MLAVTCLIAYFAALAFAVQAARPSGWPISVAARRWHPTAGWLRDAFCIHNHESVDWHRRWTDWAGHRSPYAGGMQFLQSTWTNAGGHGEPWQWAPREQLYRAFVVWRADGGSFREWGTARACGLR